jgi:Flp pilus assembly protein TadD
MRLLVAAIKAERPTVAKAQAAGVSPRGKLKKESAMKRQRLTFGTLIGACVALCLATAVPLHAQLGLGALQGRVVDENGKPVAGAEVILVHKGDINLKYTVKTNSSGRWARTGLQAAGSGQSADAMRNASADPKARGADGTWDITIRKDGMEVVIQGVQVPMGNARVVDDVVLSKATATASTPANAAGGKAAPLNSQLNEVSAAIKANDFGLATAKLTDIIAKQPTCAVCYVRLGDVYARQKDYPKSEAAFKKALELDASSADAYDGLAVVYNAQGRMDQAAEAAAKAMELQGASGGGSATSAFNAGAILVNSGKFAEAMVQFQRAILLDPSMAEAHYQLGVALVSAGNAAEAIKSLEQYLALAPKGPNAQMARDMLPELKKMK